MKDILHGGRTERSKKKNVGRDVGVQMELSSVNVPVQCSLVVSSLVVSSGF